MYVVFNSVTVALVDPLDVDIAARVTLAVRHSRARRGALRQLLLVTVVVLVALVDEDATSRRVILRAVGAQYRIEVGLRVTYSVRRVLETAPLDADVRCVPHSSLCWA